MRSRYILLGALPLACAGPPAGTPAGARDPVQVAVRTDRGLYQPGEPIVANLTIRNDGDTAVTVRFSTSQRYDFMISTAAGDPLWRWGAGRGFLQVLGEEQIGPGEDLTFGERFTGSLVPGHYTIRGVVTAMERSLAGEATFEVR